ncbi:DUF2971 domain-containing protein [Cochleicola gelatinilyticus]|uniref:DUF2971 domain-containing protein n=1 Tax=Cochleicola gelatinilyticus TaxID=1763537 RepID=A0A167JTI9_9FLAO|nr:DUF2971 domain-containing protein [Cochleicola gelatinilyticus]OAB81032.1 hypothetical protein ULVI_01865 [Cochleicola gelatinilyticus]
MLVYKYRSGTDDDIKALENNQYWSSSIEQLNDPCEAITDTKKVKKLLNYIGQKVGAKTKEDFELINDNTDKVLSMDNKMGIYSLSKTPLDELLWAHYANSHKGFCIEYDLDILLKNDGENHIHSFPVLYSNKPASFSFLDLIRNKQNSMIKKFAFHKSKRWEYEQEHRIVTSKIGLNSYNHKALKSIYFGLKISESDKYKIINLLRLRDVNFYQIELEKNSYSFKSIKLETKTELESHYLKQLPTSITNGKIIEFEILKQKIFNFSGIGEFKVMLKQELNNTEIELLMNYLKKNLFCDGKTLFFEFFTDLKQIENLPWVSATIKKEKIEIQFNY